MFIVLVLVALGVIGGGFSISRHRGLYRSGPQHSVLDRAVRIDFLVYRSSSNSNFVYLHLLIDIDTC